MCCLTEALFVSLSISEIRVLKTDSGVRNPLAALSSMHVNSTQGILSVTSYRPSPQGEKTKYLDILNKTSRFPLFYKLVSR